MYLPKRPTLLVTLLVLSWGDGGMRHAAGKHSEHHDAEQQEFVYEVSSRLVGSIKEGKAATTWRAISCLRRFDRHLAMLVFAPTFDSSAVRPRKKNKLFDSNISRTVAPALSRVIAERHGIAGSRLSILAQTTASLFCSQNYSLALRWLSLHDYLSEGSKMHGQLRELEEEGSQSVGSIFQKSIVQIASSQQDESCFRAAQLLRSIVRIRRRSKGSDHVQYETYIYQARLSMLFHHYSVAISALERIMTGGRENDAQALCLLVNAQDSNIELRGQQERYQRLSRVLRQLFQSFSPPASQCISPFSALASPLTPLEALMVARSAAVRERSALRGVKSLSVRRLEDLLPNSPDRRISVGYITSEWGDNSVGREIHAVLERHSARRVRPVCFMLKDPLEGSLRAREWREKTSRACGSGLVPLHHLSDVEGAERVNKERLHVLVDLNGWMSGSRVRILALQPAMLQINYKNFVGSMGADFEPFIVTDKVCSPPEFVQDYQEKLLLMPRSFYVTEDYSETHPECLQDEEFSVPHKREIVEVARAQSEQRGVKRSGGVSTDVVIANFNNWKKLDMRTLRVWAKVMGEVPNSILWLMSMLPYEGPSGAVGGGQEELDRCQTDSLKSILQSLGVDASRVVITGLLPSETHLIAKQQATDVFLDSLAYNAHSTAVELIWANVPVLTCPELKMTARVASSLLLAHGMSALVAREARDMEDVAVRLLRERRHLKRMRSELRRRRRSGSEDSLFDISQWTRSFEDGLFSLLEASASSPRHLHIVVSSSGPDPRRQ
ncbi:hypothetical protein GUITHDRAFT_135804 [Guillardia theta CCMP2712]|uniref:O-GlcNAc transferase C-terminal domain-containing protein n=1 Tax=Guillardia theta (strain CCMP2712) TaxID=905079 RepID=L1JME2_GUITC|nr:hypothetical protein GUITHDRAFT_135804 [Guillardia theta CCMP2712]EKX49617.1 hypothetical protein GUITHDRAFT_135804 [Guillardia theta CCMP2712]|eukprot:XP_005836597.1 hypothetical protein GUITHDRAFT_135804 [Guillardia theta CCMP2712]